MYPFGKKKDEQQPPTGATPPPADTGAGHGPTGEVDPDQTAQALDELQSQVTALGEERERLIRERDEAQHAHKLALADFQNYQRR
ncbi:MAG: hypothetical protein ACT4PL_11345, partial [Phycisphaerales bacterium]